MKKIINLTLISLLLSGCASSALGRNTPFSPEEMYEGYPCRKECDTFKNGYDGARNRQLKDADLCQGETLSEIAGCRAYIADEEFDQKIYKDLTLID
jgi:hypothetical protein